MNITSHSNTSYPTVKYRNELQKMDDDDIGIIKNTGGHLKISLKYFPWNTCT